MDLNREVGEVKTQVRFLTQEIHEIKTDVKTLLRGHWKFYGAALFAAFLSTFIVEIAKAVILK